jgi:hypothetical protein
MPLIEVSPDIQLDSPVGGFIEVSPDIQLDDVSRPPEPGISTTAPSPVAPASPPEPTRRVIDDVDTTIGRPADVLDPGRGVAAPISVTDTGIPSVSFPELAKPEQEAIITSAAKVPLKPKTEIDIYDRAVPIVTRGVLKLLAPGMPKDIQQVWQDAGERVFGDFIRGAVGTVGSTVGGVGLLPGMPDMMQDFSRQVDEWAKEKAPKDPQFFDAVAGGFGSLLAYWYTGKGIASLLSFAPKLAAWMGAGTMAALEGLSEANDVYQSTLKKGKPKEEADWRAFKTFAYNFPLITITNRFGFFAEKGGPIRKGLTSAVTEGPVQEGTQYLIGQSQKGEDIRLKDWLTATGVGSITGLVVGGLARPGVRLTEEQKAEIRADEAIKEVSQALKPERAQKEIGKFFEQLQFEQEEAPPVERERAFKEPAFPTEPPPGAPPPSKPPPPGKYEFTDPEQEAAFKGARGIRKPTLFERAKDFSTSIKNKVTREFEHLPKTKDFAQLRFDLVKLAKQKGVQLENVITEQKKVLGELDPNSYDLFERRVILDSFASDLDRGLKVPFGFTSENLPQEIERLNSEIAKQPRVQAALQKREEVFNTFRDEYVAAAKNVGLDLSERLNDPNYFRHQVLDHIEASRLTGVGKKLKTPAFRSFLKKKAGTKLDINTNYLQAETEVLSKMAYDTQVFNTIKRLDARDNIAPQVRAEAKEQELDDWRDEIPEGHSIWQPREGNLFYMADSIPAKLAADLESGTLKEIGLTADQVKKVLAVGGKRKEFVLKDEIVATLDNLQKKKPQGFLEGLDRKALRLWKQWQLISPRRYAKYNIRNVSGDADAAFIGNPRGFLKTKQAVLDFYSMLKSGGEKVQTLQDWFDRGGMGGTLQAQEMGEIDRLDSFKNLVEKRFRGRDIPAKIWKGYWNKARVSTDLREAVLRYGNYLSYLEQMQANPKGRPDNFGASIPEEIMALPDIKDRAYWLSNDLLGAYDRVGVMGQTLREYWYPFWSWQEVNMVRYKRFIQNAVNDGRTAEMVGKVALKGVKTSAYKSFRIGKFLLKATALWSAFQAYNNFRYPELEKKLSKEKQARPHIVLGEDKNGNIITFDRLGALGDILEWFGLDVAPKFVDDWFKGRMTLKEIAFEMAKSPPNKMIQGLHPFVKTTGELLTRKALFPKAFEPRAIRDRWFHLFRSFGLENEYVAVTDKPSRGFAESLSKALIYKSDPEQEAYSEIFNLKNRFLKSINKGGDGFWMSPKGNATYNLKLALRYQDEEASKKFLLEYVNLGGTPEGLMQSLQRMHPLAGLSEMTFR